MHEAIQVIDEILETHPNDFDAIRQRCGVELAIILAAGGTPTLERFDQMLELGGAELTGDFVFDAALAYAIAASDSPQQDDPARLISRSRELFVEARRRGIDPELPAKRPKIQHPPHGSASCLRLP
jgi:hypothetical protein